MKNDLNNINDFFQMTHNLKFFLLYLLGIKTLKEKNLCPSLSNFYNFYMRN